jgi:hypothetical protein
LDSFTNWGKAMPLSASLPCNPYKAKYSLDIIPDDFMKLLLASGSKYAGSFPAPDKELACGKKVIKISVKSKAVAMLFQLQS